MQLLSAHFNFKLICFDLEIYNLIICLDSVPDLNENLVSLLSHIYNNNFF